jgi:ABC-type glycerol-3-phosphate transport system permease component
MLRNMKDVRWGRFGMHAVLVLGALVVILPVVWIAFAAFKTQIALLRGDLVFTPYLGNFEELLFSKGSDYPANFLSSALVASGSTAVVRLLHVPTTVALLGSGVRADGFTRISHDSADHAGRAVVRDVPFDRLG